MSAQNSHNNLIDPDASRAAPPPVVTASVSAAPVGIVPLGTAPVGTARIGAELRQVRERAGWKLADVAAELRIRETYLDAIERGELEALPGPAYQIGFVRAYSQIMGLDGNEILRRFRAEGLGAAKKPELSFLAPVPDRAVPSGAIVLLGIVLLLVGYGLWFLHTETDQTMADLVPAVPTELAPLALPPAPQTKPSAGQMAQPVQPVKTPIAASGTVAGAAPAPGTATSTTLTTPPAPPSGATQAAPGAAVLSAEPAGKAILATGDSWVEVKDASGNILFSRLMREGDTWPVPDLPGLTMTSGNAGGTEIADHATTTPPLGAAGTVVRNYALTPAQATPPNPAKAAP